jgi:hypothetical protein
MAARAAGIAPPRGRTARGLAVTQRDAVELLRAVAEGVGLLRVRAPRPRSVAGGVGGLGRDLQRRGPFPAISSVAQSRGPARPRALRQSSTPISALARASCPNPWPLVPVKDLARATRPPMSRNAPSRMSTCEGSQRSFLWRC